MLSVQDLSTSLSSSEGNPSNTEVLVNSALLGRILMLEAESSQLKAKLAAKSWNIIGLNKSNTTINYSIFTWVLSHMKFLCLFEFFGPVVNELNYWGSKKVVQRHYKCKFNPVNQLFLTLVKLRLGLKSNDVAFDLVFQLNCYQNT